MTSNPILAIARRLLQETGSIPGPELIDAILIELPGRERRYVRETLERSVLDGTFSLNSKLEIILP